MPAADGLVRNEEVAGATPAALTISGRQADTSWLHLSRKQDRHRRGRSITDAFRQFETKPKNIVNIIMQLFRFLLRSGVKTKSRKQDPPVENTASPATDKSHHPKRVPFSDDDSPPGYKTRWHH